MGSDRETIQKPGAFDVAVDGRSSRKRPVELLTRDEAIALIEGCGRGPCGRRNRALIVVMWRGGLRCAEAIALMPRDIGFDAGTLNNRHGKGDQQRITPIDHTAMQVLWRWAQVRSAALEGRGITPAMAAHRPFFCTLKGTPLDDSYVRWMVSNVKCRAGIAKRCHPHGLRHTYAVELAREGKRPDVIRRLLGHSSLAVTDRYLNHVSAEDLNHVSAEDLRREIASREAW